ncbi:aldo/keto reductase [Planococcus halotolerans]|uniref:aldo/keto reductase n=1 Tax=Planococcus halotolerans TaxID=2233542 RepID=UPI001093311B|nr:hypothetical protein DNR44_008285 [Planococcus halotolerans]
MIYESFGKVAKAHGRTPVQAVLRWHLQKDTIAIPKPFAPSRIEENFNVSDFELSVEEADCQSLNIVFEKNSSGEWVLMATVNNRWTI